MNRVYTDEQQARRREKDRLWRSTNPERVRERNRLWRSANADLRRANVRNRRRATAETIIRRKAGVPCADCGGTFHHSAMDYDHLPGEVKANNISAMLSCGEAAIEAEIAKCELVCANCHRVRTYERRNR